MKKIYLLIPFFVVTLNAEMIGVGETGTFISTEEKAEMNALLKPDKEDEEVQVEKTPESIGEEEKFVPEKENLGEGLKPKENITDFDIDEINSPSLLPEKKQKIENKNKHKKIPKAGEDDLAIGGEVKEIPFHKLEMKQYNIRYDKSYDAYSCEEVNPKIFKDYVEKKKINKSMFKKMLGSDENLQTIKLSAFYYDYYMSRPDYAENFYKLMYKNKDKLSISELFVLADYIIRTGRGELMNKVLSHKKCATIFKSKPKAKCFYYLGIGEYLRTGKRKNKYIKSAKSNFPKAKLFYKGKI